MLNAEIGIEIDVLCFCAYTGRSDSRARIAVVFIFTSYWCWLLGLCVRCASCIVCTTEKKEKKKKETEIDIEIESAHFHCWFQFVSLSDLTVCTARIGWVWLDLVRNYIVCCIHVISALSLSCQIFEARFDSFSLSKLVSHKLYKLI